MLCKLKGPGHCKSAKRMTSILRHVVEALFLGLVSFIHWRELFVKLTSSAVHWCSMFHPTCWVIEADTTLISSKRSITSTTSSASVRTSIEADHLTQRQTTNTGPVNSFGVPVCNIITGLSLNGIKLLYSRPVAFLGFFKRGSQFKKSV